MIWGSGANKGPSQKTGKTVEFSVGAKQTPWWERAAWRPTGRCQDLRAFVLGMRIAQTSSPSHAHEWLKAEPGQCCEVGIPAWEVG
jgi:hypothetical protein